MAFDGVTISALRTEFKSCFTGAHIRKIAQPEPDELILTIQTPAGGINGDDPLKKRATLKLKLSANASLPLCYLTSENKTSPLSAPNFCMLLRKHISGARIEDVIQEGMERVLRFILSTKNELGDDVKYSLVIEIMGKHSNIVFLDENDMIIDSIKHVNGLMSSVREVLPGRDYFIPNTMDKISPYDVDTDYWQNVIFKKPTTIAKAISASMTGISTVMAFELCNRAKLDGDAATASLNGNDKSALMDSFRAFIDELKSEHFSPVLYYRDDIPYEFSSMPLSMYDDLHHEESDSISEVVERFYIEKDTLTRIRSKSTELKTTVQNAYERVVKKMDLLTKQLSDTQKRDKFKVYGELITTYGYSMLPELPVRDDLPEDEMPNNLHCINYHDDTEIDIPIDPRLSVADNANKYFDKYNKLKRTKDAVSEQLSEAKTEYEHLESILTELSIARHEQDLIAIRKELADHGYIKKQSGKKGNKNLPKSEPLHFISSDGYDIYVGKNNYQNDMLTFKIATGNDWWFHAKQMPGSHVIVRCGNEEPPVTTFEDAAALAALFSKGGKSEKLEIDYTQKKNVKKPGGARPGFVIYYTNYSMVANSENLKRIKPNGPEEEGYL